MTVSRRSFLSHLTLSAGVYCSRQIAAPPEPPTPLDAEPLYDGQLHPHELAMFIARLELGSVQETHPRTWHELRYVRSIPWSNTITITYGIGEPTGAMADYQAAGVAIEASLLVDDGRRIISRHVTPCGWGWAIAVERAPSDE